MKLHDVSWNHTHRGHHMKASAQQNGLTQEQLRAKMAQLIDEESRCCRIWVDNKCVWYYGTNAARHEDTSVQLDKILAEVEAL